MRTGFTLIEIVLALLLFQFGMLALAGASAVAARDLAAANRRARAQALAEARVARLRAGRCPAPAAGSQRAPGGLEEYWRVAAHGRAREVVDSVAMELPGARTSSLVLRAWVLCD